MFDLVLLAFGPRFSTDTSKSGAFELLKFRLQKTDTSVSF